MKANKLTFGFYYDYDYYFFFLNYLNNKIILILYLIINSVLISIDLKFLRYLLKCIHRIYYIIVKYLNN